ncbi:MAG: two component transcriptional regulator, winged helix family [Dehalococcoidia bacterium]|nr:two component transcriptional regulator, winged helix family [Dehalococcoidia bacterium]
MVKEKILVVDDEPGIVELVRLNLEDNDYQVVTAQDGQRALEAYYSEMPDLIVLDIMMPKMNGFEVCQTIRRQSNVPIIMLTALSDAEEELKGLESGADDYIGKPFSPGELVARVRAVLRRAKKQASPL